VGAGGREHRGNGKALPRVLAAACMLLAGPALAQPAESPAPPPGTAPAPAAPEPLIYSVRINGRAAGDAVLMRVDGRLFAGEGDWDAWHLARPQQSIRIDGETFFALDDAPGFAITETHFYPISADEVAIPPALAGATKVAQQISNVVIEPDGRISGCEGIRYSGAASPATDACRILTGTRFEAAPAGAKPLVGTVVTTAYTQTQTIT